MRIGFDAKRAFSNYTGLGNYSRSTLRILINAFPENQYFLYTPRVPDENQIQFVDLPHHSQHHIRIPKSIFYELFPFLWRAYGITKDIQHDRLDIYHGLSHELPIGISKTNIKSIVTIHDLIFLRYPEFYKPADRKIYESKFRYACTHANKIIAISEQTKKDLIYFFSIDEKKIEVVYQSCAPIFYKKKTEEEKKNIRAKYHLPEKFLLNVGTIEERKNVLLLIKALKQLKEKIPVVIIGRSTSYTDRIKAYISEHQLESYIYFIHKVDFSDLPAIYQSAEIFIYPSLFEGFGIPIIEALHSGVPVIAAKGSCLEEAGGNYSLYVDPDNDIQLADAIETILYDSSVKNKMIEEGYKYAEKFKEATIANALMQTYTKTLKS